MPNVKFVKLTENAKPPLYATDGSAGADLFAAKACFVEPGETAMVSTGVSLEIPAGFGGFVFSRSSVAVNHCVSLVNCVGVIDSDYRGELKVPLVNRGISGFKINLGDRIAQIVFLPCEQAVFSETTALAETKRGSGGFGSTGIL